MFVFPLICSLWKLVNYFSYTKNSYKSTYDDNNNRYLDTDTKVNLQLVEQIKKFLAIQV